MSTTYRAAQAGDEQAIYNLLVIMHRENADEPLSEPRVRARIRQCMTQGQVILAENNGVIVGSIGVIVERHWWTDAEHLADSWIFVHPGHRTLKTFLRLIQIGKGIAENLGMPFKPAVVGIKDLERKDRVFSRHFHRKGFLYTTEN